ISADSLSSTPLTSDMLAINQTLATLFQLSDLLGDVTAITEDEFNQEDGLNTAEAYGDLLVALSGLDEFQGSVAATLEALLAEVSIVDGVALISTHGIALLQAGLALFESGPYSGVLDSQSVIALAPVVTEARDGLLADEAEDGTVVTLKQVAVGDLISITLGDLNYDVTATVAMVSDGYASITLPADLLEELGDGNWPLTVSVNGDARLPIYIEQEISRPTLRIDVDRSDLAAGEHTVVTFTFSEAVIGFSNADITLDSGSLSTVTTTDGGVTWTATYTPADNTEDSGTRIQIGGEWTDLVNNAPAVGADNLEASISIQVDTVAPVASIDLSTHVLAVGETATVTIRFHEAVTGFGLEDLSADNATFSNLISTDGGTTWTATLTPSDNISSDDNRIYLSSGYTDAVGNQPTSDVISASYQIDTQAPVFTSATTATAINENSGENAVIYTATTDDAAAVVYSLSGADAALFSINSATGEVTLLADADYESKSSYSFVVTATDGAGNHTDQTVTLAVNNLDEAA
ncbi:Ig-like domain-containing protein, partial [Oceanobacter sp. 3_MG-2023]|uniref:Ig-like domain-containing protein n=1 Tax=Oceanobacter sp. 3_MG-2023 TaxID=3062622 RepID=UPI0027328F41